MSRFIYMQDKHASGRNSVNYIGDYFQDGLLMLDEILEIAKQYKVDGILDGGDLLDTPEPSYRVIDEIADRVEKAGIIVYSLFGNHAERYHSMEHSRYTGLAHLQKRSKFFKYLDLKTGKDFYIEGYEYRHDIEEWIKEEGLFCDKGKDKWKIAIVHAFICPKTFPYASHVICDDIKTDFDIVLVAHYHSEWEKKVGNTLFKDIGCVGRMSVTEYNITPKVLLIDTDKRSITEIPLKSAKPGNEIFDLEKLKEVKVLDEDIANFIKSIESVEFQGVVLDDLIKKCGKENNFEQEPINLLLNKIEELK